MTDENVSAVLRIAGGEQWVSGAKRILETLGLEVEVLVSDVPVLESENRDPVGAVTEEREKADKKVDYAALLGEVDSGMSRLRFHEIALLAGWVVKATMNNYQPEPKKSPCLVYKNVTYMVPHRQSLVTFAVEGSKTSIRCTHIEMLRRSLEKKLRRKAK